MQTSYEKAIAVGIAGILLIFIMIYLSTTFLGFHTASVADDQSSMAWVVVVVSTTLLCLFIIGFITACVASNDLSSLKGAVKVSAVSGLVPMSLLIVGILYLILYLGILAALPFFILGLALVVVGISFSAIGGAVGYSVACIYLKPDPLLQ